MGTQLLMNESDEAFCAVEEPAAACGVYVSRRVASDRVLKELNNLPEVEYPEEVVARWVSEVEATRAQLSTGELVPRTVAEYMAERGIKLG
jgi:hypothetical protein